MKLSDFDVLTFDCYGTLIDWETGLLDALAPWLDRHGATFDREQILEAYAEVEARLEEEHPAALYPEILARAMEALGQRWGLDVREDEARTFGASVPDWPAFPDSPEALQELGRHFQLVILSNVDRRSFAGSERRLGVSFDRIFTAQDIGSYKPDPRNFDYLLEQLKADGIAPGKILHTAQSLFHDHVPAKAAGLATAWIDRRHDKEGWGATAAPEEEVRPDFRFESLGAMAEAVERE